MFKVGDIVRTKKEIHPWNMPVGFPGIVTAISTDINIDCQVVTFAYGSGGSINLFADVLEKVTADMYFTEQVTFKREQVKEEIKPMTKYYELLKDTPEYVAGVIVQGSHNGHYKAINPELFATKAEQQSIDAGYPSSYFWTFVENGDLFKQVYAVNISNSQTVYVSQAEARAALKGNKTDKK